jgi:prepilin-type N-terminal cleavage/methylation domain-containing protein
MMQITRTKKNLRRWAMGKTRGFTLVELAIVLVIIGIILGAILKGTELINNAKVKRLQNDLKGLEAAIWTFYDRTGRMPGDCNGDGVIGYGIGPGATGTGLTFSSNTDPTIDSCASDPTETNPNKAFSDLRVQRVLSYSQPNINLARHVFNDYFVIGSIASGGKNYNAIVIYGIPAWAAKMIDVSIDGSANGTAGRVRRYDDTGWPDWPDDAHNDQVVSLAYFFDTIP